MRTGKNPAIDQKTKPYGNHRVIIPVFIPAAEGYFEHLPEILALCLESLRLTAGPDVNVTIISNGSHPSVVEQLQQEREKGWIDQLVLQQENRGRLNSILPHVRSVYEEMLTVSDCDVLFCPDWQQAVEDIFRSFPECGFATLNPNPLLTGLYSSATMLGGLMRRELQLKKVVPDEDLNRFAHSVGRPDMYGPTQRSKQLIVQRNGTTACVGGGHYVFTLRRNVAQAISGDLWEGCMKGTDRIDMPPDRLGYWRLSTTRCYAYHMGNTPEPWMYRELEQTKQAAAVRDKRPEQVTKSYPDRRHWTASLPLRLRQKLVSLLKKTRMLPNYGYGAK